MPLISGFLIKTGIKKQNNMIFLKFISGVGFFFIPSLVLAASFSVLPSTGAHKTGETFSVTVYLNTEGKEALAADLELLYPSDLLEVIDANTTVAGIQITPGTLMSQNQLNTVSGGRIRFAQIAPIGEKLVNTVPGTLATIMFRAIKSGTAPVTVEFTLGDTRDSNIAALGGIDLLSSVTNATFTLTGDPYAPTSSYTFSRNLKVGMRGEDVRQLQKFLNENGFVIASAGDGSKGRETDYFGNLTKTAVIRFQETHTGDILTPVGLTRGSGYFGPSTRNKIHGLLRLTLPTQASPQAQSQISQLQEQIRQAQEQVNRLIQQCTQEAMLCPDGSAVSRTGLNCEFMPCPAIRN